MIRKNTVLILGAGASNEYGFPTAAELKDIVCKKTAAPPCPQGDDSIARLFASLRELLSYSGWSSIDAFLGSLPQGDRLIDIGRAAILDALIPFEVRDNPLFNQKGLYKYLFQKMCTDDNGLSIRLAENLHLLSQNKLRILTFNYDRSFEHFLVTRISQSLVSQDTAWAEVKKLKLIHLYGTLGDYSPRKTGGGERRYEHEVYAQNIPESLQKINIVRDSEHHTPAFVEAEEILKQAEMVVLLGFGFDQANLSRLNLSVVPKSAPIYATAFRLSNSRKQAANESAGRDITFGDTNETCSEFVRNRITLD